MTPAFLHHPVDYPPARKSARFIPSVRRPALRRRSGLLAAKVLILVLVVLFVLAWPWLTAARATSILAAALVVAGTVVVGGWAFTAQERRRPTTFEDLRRIRRAGLVLAVVALTAGLTACESESTHKYRVTIAGRESEIAADDYYGPYAGGCVRFYLHNAEVGLFCGVSEVRRTE